ncbi:uncharacterized protein SPSK_01590 [Sporothrix schenckii 1099-18]|uniref:DUF6546 domain-containing protein n=1 Tax=Sporothrix schenckii 1099-18 TaxID=1397361 RepID=A0A0F2MCQ4_SPOSC|nr:uncharacterized protein SPSK_01590 [Sporothrix schenckii 1099-18]KJR86869.1 hypothetical protein SPSK_01590 [Sporothrix schenckii 1099-18]
MASWQRLPTEIKLAIWGSVAKDAEDDRRTRKLQLDKNQKPVSLAPFAAVALDWQSFFEQVTFRRLFIEDDQVDRFAALVKGPRKKQRLGFIQHLHFHGRLDDYDCSQCSTLPSTEALKRDDERLVVALSALIAVLATWDDTPTGQDRQDRQDRHGGLGGQGPAGLTLELSSSSWSDPYHTIRNFRHYREYPYDAVEDMDETCTAYDRYRVRERDFPNNTHGWEAGVWRQRLAGAASAIGRVLGGEPLGHAMQLARPIQAGVANQLDNSQVAEIGDVDVAPVKIVHTLMMRRRFYRSIDQRLFQTLVSCTSNGLDGAHMEVWEPESIGRTCNYFVAVVTEVEWRIEWSRGGEAILECGWGSGLRSLSVYMDINVYLTWRQFHHPYGPVLPKASTDVQKIVRSTRLREHVALSYVLDATTIFESAKTQLQAAKDTATDQTSQITGAFWPRITTLALTDICLAPNQPVEYGSRAVRLAAEMITHMPALEILELWYGNKEHGCLFRFESTRRSAAARPVITILTTWDAQPAWWTPELESLWAESAALLSPYPLRVEHRVLPEMLSPTNNRLAPYMRVIGNLVLRDRVIDPVSLYDMVQDPTYAVSWPE